MQGYSKVPLCGVRGFSVIEWITRRLLQHFTCQYSRSAFPIFQLEALAQMCDSQPTIFSCLRDCRFTVHAGLYAYLRIKMTMP